MNCCIEFATKIQLKIAPKNLTAIYLYDNTGFQATFSMILFLVCTGSLTDEKKSHG